LLLRITGRQRLLFIQSDVFVNVVVEGRTGDNSPSPIPNCRRTLPRETRNGLGGASSRSAAVGEWPRSGWTAAHHRWPENRENTLRPEGDVERR